MTVGIIAGWITLSFVVGAVANSIGRSFANFFFLSLLFSPLIGFVILAVQGRATVDEILNKKEHIFFCPNCYSIYSSFLSDNDVVDNCPKCGTNVIETTILSEDWRSYSREKKEKIKEAIQNGQFIRNELQNSEKANSVADEIKKFRELRDSGAITNEEYEAKKKQLLGL